MNLTRFKRSALLAAIVLLCGSGAWISNGLLELHDGGSGESSSAGRFIARLCYSNPEEHAGCQAAAQSAWSEVHLPIPGRPTNLPVALVAIAYFLALATWYAFIGEARPAWKPLKWLPIAIAAAGIYSSLFFVSLMVMGRAPWCGGCAAVHAINLLLVTSIGLSRRWGPASESAAMEIGHRQSVAIIIFSMVLIGVVYSSRNRLLILQDRLMELGPDARMVESIQEKPQLLMDAYLSETKHSSLLRPDEINPGAKHELLIFLDFECPACQIMDHEIRGEIATDFGNTLNVVVRHFPLCVACNPKIPRTIHASACTAAYAAEAARALGGAAAFERMSNLLFMNQSDLSDAIGRDLAVAAGIDTDQFLKLLHGPAVQKRVADDVNQGNALGVTNTPTLFLDGRRVPQICHVPAFWQAVAKAPTSEPISQ